MSENSAGFAKTLPEHLLLVSGEGQLLAADPYVATQFGLTEQQLGNTRLSDLVTDPPEQVKRFLSECSKSTEPVVGGLNFRVPGQTLACRCEGAALLPCSSDFPAHVLLRLKIQDSSDRRFTHRNKQIEELSGEIWQRRQVEQALHDREQQLNAIVHQAIVGVAQVDLTGRFVLVNQRYCKLVGRSLEQILS